MRLKTGSTVLRRDLGALAFEYSLEASQRGFIGGRLFPIKDVEEQSAAYPKIKLAALIKLAENIKRAPRGNYARSDYEFESDTYKCQEYGWEELLDDVERNLYRNYIDGDEIATMRAVDMLLRHREARIAAKVFNTSNITNNTGVSKEWSSASDCTPRADVKLAKKNMREATGLEPDVMVISKKVFDNLMIAKEITDAFRYTNPIELGGEEVQRRLLAQYLGIGEVLVGNAIKDSAKKGQSATIADIWDDEYAGFFKIAKTEDMKEPALGRTFLWTADSPNELVTETYREENKRCDVVRVRHNLDEAFVWTSAGYLLSNITA